MSFRQTWLFSPSDGVLPHLIDKRLPIGLRSYATWSSCGTG